MLQEIFGTAINHIIGGNATAAENATANMLGTAFGFFNGGVLFFGSILLTWVTIFGLTNTANDGQVLGKKWSTFYTPLRTFTASAFLIPSTSGYSMVQLAILLIVTWSVGFASNMWGKVVDYVVNTQAIEQAVQSIQEDPNFDQMAYNALRMQVCAYAATQGINQTMGQGTVNFQPLYVNDSSLSIGARNSPELATLAGGGAATATGIATASTLGGGAIMAAAGGAGLVAGVLVANPYVSTTYTTTVVMKDSKWTGSEDICGRMVLTNTYIRPDTHSTASQDVAASVRNAVNTIRFKYAIALLDPNGDIGGIAKEVIQVAESQNQTISAKSVNDRIVAIRSRMMGEITREVRNQVSNDNAALLQKFKEKGWVMAGSLHRELAQIKDAIRNVTTAKSEYVPGSSNVSHLMASGAVSVSIQTVMARYDSLVATIIQKGNPNNNVVSTTGKPTLPSLQTNFTADDFTDGGNSIKSKITSYYSKLPDLVMQGLIFHLAEDGSDPVMQVKNIGDWMAAFAEAVLLTKALAVSSLDGVFAGLQTAAQQQIAGFSASAFGAPVIGIVKFCITLIAEFWAIVSPGVMTLLYGGYFLGMWIPMVPFYVFALGVIGWLVQVVESMAAGAFWMVMHLTPERDDSFIGSQQQGYLLLMSLFSRPPLMVLGVVASMAILNPAVRFVNAGFIASFRIIQSDSVTGLLSIAGYMMIYCVIIFGVFMLVFSLPQTLPDRILRWIGAGISDLGEQGTMGRIESSASGQARTAAVAGSARYAAMATARKPPGGGGDSVRRGVQQDISGTSDRNSAPEGHTGPPL